MKNGNDSGCAINPVNVELREVPPWMFDHMHELTDMLARYGPLMPTQDAGEDR